MADRKVDPCRIPRNNGASQGQSAATVDKERRIGSALSIGMRIAAKAPKYPFWHFDANAGSGWNDKVDVPGTPLVFWTLANQLMPEMRVYAFFSEILEQNVAELQKRLSRENQRVLANSYILPGDNAEGIEVFAERIRASGDRPAFATGSIVVDPNGYFYRNLDGIGAPVKQLLEFASVFPRVDIILNLNYRTYQMQKPHNHPGLMPPLEIFAALRKEYWLVARTKAGGSSFLLAIGRNFKTGEHKGLGLHALESVEGQHIINKIEGKDQTELF